jgi:hypothetical protein
MNPEQYPILTKLRLSETGLSTAVRPLLEGRVFHVSRLSNLELILACREIRPNQDGALATTFGSAANSFFRNRGCVSLFDYRSVSPEELTDATMKCSPTQPATPESGIVIFMLAAASCPALLSWQLWKAEQAWREMVVPHIEAGHHGPIPLALVDEIICIEIEEDPNSIAYLLRQARRSAAEESRH